MVRIDIEAEDLEILSRRLRTMTDKYTTLCNSYEAVTKRINAMRGKVTEAADELMTYKAKVAYLEKNIAYILRLTKQDADNLVNMRVVHDVAERTLEGHDVED